MVLQTTKQASFNFNVFKFFYTIHAYAMIIGILNRFIFVPHRQQTFRFSSIPIFLTFIDLSVGYLLFII